MFYTAQKGRDTERSLERTVLREAIDSPRNPLKKRVIFSTSMSKAAYKVSNNGFIDRKVKYLPTLVNDVKDKNTVPCVPCIIGASYLSLDLAYRYFRSPSTTPYEPKSYSLILYIFA